MRIVINGGSVAGLASAAFLRLIPTVQSITVLDVRREGSFSMRDHCIGLWNPVIEAFEALKVHNFPRKGKFLIKSGYRDWKKGNWLMRPYTGTSMYVHGGASPSLGFFKNSDVLSTLSECCSGNESAKVPVNFLFGESCVDIVNNNQILTSKGALLDCDLLVAADGSHSAVYDILHKNAGSVESRLEYRGYDVYRGTVKLDADLDAFQTWGPGARFAIVPSPVDGSGSGCGPGNSNSSDGGNSKRQRYGSKHTMTKKKNASEYSWFAAVSGKEDTYRGDNSKESKELRGPLSNGTSIATAAAMNDVKSLLSDWHQPIGKALSSSGHIDHVATVTPAWASVQVEKQLNRIYSHDSTVSGVLGAAGIPCAFVGDSFHTFDPILAIGAGAAIEQARYLATAVEGHPDDLALALKIYNAKASSRAQRLKVISDLTQKVSFVESTILGAYRDAILSILPEKAKGKAMDFAIRIVAGME